MNGTCDHKGCRAASDVRPVLLLFSPIPNTCPAKGVISREYCTVCARLLTVDEFVTDEGWASLSASFTRMGKMAPDRSRVQLRMEPLIHAERN